MAHETWASTGLVLSLVSHGHRELVQALLQDLARLCSMSVTRVVLTLNVPEPPPIPPAGGWPFQLDVRMNQHPMGFGANHNRALEGASERFVGVLNPDVGLRGQDPFVEMVALAGELGVGCVYPQQVDRLGRLQAGERQLPTPWSLLLRRAWSRVETRVDWVNAACLVLPQHTWQTLGGFDESYFMYCEDVDLSLRLRLSGKTLVCAQAKIEHVGQRASGRSLRHLSWHIRSLLRLWCSPVFWQARQLLQSDVTSGGRISPP